MLTENDFLIPEWPEVLQHVDIVRARFALNFTSSCQVQPADFLELRRSLRLAGRNPSDSRDATATQQLEALLHPPLSADPIARRKFQKPAPAFVITMPIMQQQLFGPGDKLDLEVLFIGTGIPLIHDFLRSLIHLGHLGLVAGEGRFEVTETHNKGADCSEVLIWEKNVPLEGLTCYVQSLAWVLQDVRITGNMVVNYITPTRLMVDGKPLRKPCFMQVFPFMLRRVTSMLYAHSGVEVLDNPAYLLDDVRTLDEVESKLHWHDWHSLKNRRGLTIGGFLGEMALNGEALREIYWVLAIASLFGIGKGATYGAGRFVLSS